MGLTQNLGRLSPSIFSDASLNIGVGAAPSGSYKFEVTGTSKVSGVLTLGSTLSNGTYTYTLPSATGTLALTSDIPSLTGYVPYTGATANLTLGIYNLNAGNININGGGSGGGALRLKQFASSEANLEGYNSISTLTSGVFYFTSSASVPNFKNFVLNPSGLTDNTLRSYTLPNANGTLALTSDLSGYLPLTGGTLTGALGGTSASFSGNVAINGTIIGTDQTFGGAYRTFAFGTNANGFNRIFAANDASDGLYINAATGQGINFRVNGGGSNVVSISSTGAATFSSTINSGTITATSLVSNGQVSLYDYINVQNNYPNFSQLSGMRGRAYYQTNYPTSILMGDPTASNTNIITFNVSDGDVTGTEKMRVTSAGISVTGAATFSSSVTINGASATTSLNVIGSGPNGILLDQDSASAAASSRLFFKMNTQTYAMLADSNGLNFLSGATAGSSTGSPRMTITSTGNVGIGTVSPSNKLYVVASGTATTNGDNSGLFVSHQTSGLTNDGIGVGSNGSASYKWIQSYNGSLSLNPVGNNVLIGTTTDDTVNKLQVNGAAKFANAVSTSYNSNEKQSYTSYINSDSSVINLATIFPYFNWAGVVWVSLHIQLIDTTGGAASATSHLVNCARDGNGTWSYNVYSSVGGGTCTFTFGGTLTSPTVKPNASYNSMVLTIVSR